MRSNFDVNFGKKCGSAALIKPGMHKKMSILLFVCILLCCRLVLIEFFNILNWVNTQIRCLTKLLSL